MKKLLILILILFFPGVASSQILRPGPGSGSGTGDVESVGDCTTGACLDGSSDGGTYVRIYDGDSHYTQIQAGNSVGNLTLLFPTAAPAANNYVLKSSTG